MAHRVGVEVRVHLGKIADGAQVVVERVRLFTPALLGSVAARAGEQRAIRGIHHDVPAAEVPRGAVYPGVGTKPTYYLGPHRLVIAGLEQDYARTALLDADGSVTGEVVDQLFAGGLDQLRRIAAQPSHGLVDGHRGVDPLHHRPVHAFVEAGVGQ